MRASLRFLTIGDDATAIARIRSKIESVGS